MLIILEGTDLAGKTTLAQHLTELASDLGHVVVNLHAGPLEGDALETYELSLHRDLRGHAGRDPLDPNILVIIDRWHLGEMIYGPLLRGGAKLGAHQFTHVERFLDALGAVRVVVDADWDEIQRRYAERGDALLTLTQITEVKAWYISKARQCRWRTVHSPFTHENVVELLMWATVENDRAQRTRSFPGYVGTSWPLLLLVGDEPNGHVAGTQPNPAFLPVYRNSGHILLEALHASGISSWGLANSADGTDLDALWRALGRPRVIALGRRADKCLKALSIPSVYVPHPAWVRRFDPHGIARYADKLRIAAIGGVSAEDVA